MNQQLDELPGYPFHRLDALLADLEPGGKPVILSIGEPRTPPPDFVRQEIAEATALWGRYPSAAGNPAFRDAVKSWLDRRFGLPGELIDRDRHIVPCAGSREGLYLLALTAVPRQKAGARPVVMLPNPFYHTYDAGAVLSGAEGVLLHATADNGFLPQPGDMDEALLRRAALVYLCNPTNPQGTIYDRPRLEAAIRLARQHDFLLVVDECYCEIYQDSVPPGALEICAELGEGLDNVVVLHSLSKRSGAPGMRAGFAAGDARVIEQLAKVIGYVGVAVPGPILAAATRLWGDEEHVAANRARYRRSFDVAERLLSGHPGFYRPTAGFFLWIDVGEDDKAARRLWREAGVKVMPGSYMARDDASGFNPGRRYIRLALVEPPDALEPALARVAQQL